MFSLSVRDHIMIAHGFRGEIFGPAQRLHGATYIVDCEFRRPALDPDGLVVDIGRAAMVLRDTLAGLDYRNLDEEPAFAGQNTTTEFLAHAVFTRLAARIAAGDLGAHAAGLSGLKVTLRESHLAWAAFDGALPGDPGPRNPGPGDPDAGDPNPGNHTQ